MKKILTIFIVFSLFFSGKTAANLRKEIDSSKVIRRSANIKRDNNLFSSLHSDHFVSFVYNDPETDAEIGKAIGAFNKLESSGSFTNTINPNDLSELPIGLKENKSNVEYGIVVTKAKFTTEYAVISVYARIVTPQEGIQGGKKTLYFGAEDEAFL